MGGKAQTISNQRCSRQSWPSCPQDPHAPRIVKIETLQERPSAASRTKYPKTGFRELAGLKQKPFAQIRSPQTSRNFLQGTGAIGWRAMSRKVASLN